MRTITPRILKMLQVCANRMCTRISFFVSKVVSEIRAFFLSMLKIQLKRVNHQLSRRTVGAPWTGRAREASSGPEKSLVQHGLVGKKQTSWIRKKLLLRGYKFKETKHDRFGKRHAATEAEEIDDRSTKVDVNALRWSIELFFSSFFFYDRLTTLDLRFLL